MRRRDVEVLVVGGGGAGLSAALMLAELGIDFLLVERHESTTIAPKAHIISPRTVEAYLPYGFADEVYELGSPHANFCKVRWYTSFGGDDVGDRWNFHAVDAWGGGHLKEQYARLSAYRHGNFQQNRLEPTLRRHVDERRPGAALFYHGLVGFEQDADGVTAVVLDRASGESYQVRAQYMIGADGGKMVGKALGIEMTGGEPFADAFNIHFRADMSEWIPHDDNVIKMITRPTADRGLVTGGMLNMGPTRWDKHASEWLVSVILPPEEDTTTEDTSDERRVQMIRDLLKIPDLQAEIIASNHWLIESALAERYTEGRVFLAGDAAHRHSPMGGLGLNTGIQDVHNLTWKLALVVRGKADPALLESYEAERRPVGQRNVEFATAAFFNHLAATSGFGLVPGAPPAFSRSVIESLNSDTPDGRMRRARLAEYYETIRWEFECADIELGFNYSDSPAIVPDGTPAPERDPTGHTYVQVARPGHRLPHAWLERNGEHSSPSRVSTHAIIRAGAFLLLVGADGQEWLNAAAELMTRREIAIDGYRVTPDGDFLDVEGTWGELRGHDDGGAVLVRPDGHVVMRALTEPRDRVHALTDAIDVACGRPAGVESSAVH